MLNIDHRYQWFDPNYRLQERFRLITLCPPIIAQVKDIIEGVENTQSEPTAFEIPDADAVIARRLRISDDIQLLSDIVPFSTEYLTNIKNDSPETQDLRRHSATVGYCSLFDGISHKYQESWATLHYSLQV